jgi:hypothetical protein
VTAGDSYLDRALDVTLAFHIAEIDVVILMRGEEFAQMSTCRQKGNFPAQKGERLPQILHPVDVDFVDHRGFERVCFRHEQRAFAAAPCLKRNGQHAFYGTNRTVERQFADKAEIFERRTV